jgi:hypothetical protein
VVGKQRKDCTFCRYEKCLSAGMSPQLILSEEEKQRLFKKYRQDNAGAHKNFKLRKVDFS